MQLHPPMVSSTIQDGFFIYYPRWILPRLLPIPPGYFNKSLFNSMTAASTNLQGKKLLMETQRHISAADAELS